MLFSIWCITPTVSVEFTSTLLDGGGEEGLFAGVAVEEKAEAELSMKKDGMVEKAEGAEVKRGDWE